MTPADALLAARRTPAARPAGLPAVPADAAAAYAIQAAVQASLGPIGGWKVGSPAPDSPAFTCAPLPRSGIVPSGARIDQVECPDRGVEAEIAVTLARDLPPRATPYTVAEVLDAVATAHPAIELLQSRYADVDAVDPLTNLADGLSHFGLVLGDPIPGWRALDLDAESVAVLVDGQEIKRRTGNPGGGIGRLLAWLANTGSTWSGGLKAGQVVTTGSWTAKDFVPAGAHVRMQFDRCGSVEATFA